MDDWVTSAWKNAAGGITGLSPLITILDLDDDSIEVNQGAMIEVDATNQPGIYKFDFSARSNLKSYSVFMDGTDTVPGADRFRDLQLRSPVQEILDDVPLRKGFHGPSGPSLESIVKAIFGKAINGKTLLEFLELLERLVHEDSLSVFTILDEKLENIIRIVESIDSLSLENKREIIQEIKDIPVTDLKSLENMVKSTQNCVENLEERVDDGLDDVRIDLKALGTLTREEIKKVPQNVSKEVSKKLKTDKVKVLVKKKRISNKREMLKKKRKQKEI